MEPDDHLVVAKRHLNEYASKSGDTAGHDVSEDVERLMLGEPLAASDGGVTTSQSETFAPASIGKPEHGEWLRGVQRRSQEWRDETINGDTTPMSQAGHAAVEASELLDEIIKAETYEEDSARAVYDRRRRELMTEAGDVIIAHLGTLSLLGLDAVACIEAALEKNGARDWEGWQDAE